MRLSALRTFAIGALASGVAVNAIGYGGGGNLSPRGADLVNAIIDELVARGYISNDAPSTFSAARDYSGGSDFDVRDYYDGSGDFDARDYYDGGYNFTDARDFYEADFGLGHQRALLAQPSQTFNRKTSRQLDRGYGRQGKAGLGSETSPERQRRTFGSQSPATAAAADTGSIGAEEEG